MVPGHSFGLKKCYQVLQQFLRFEHSAVTGFTTCLLTITHVEHRCTIGLEQRQIALSCRVGPHLAVHGRSQQQGH